MVVNKITKLKRIIDEHYENIKNITTIIKLELDKKHILAIDIIILKISEMIIILNDMYNKTEKEHKKKNFFSRSTLEYKNIDEYNLNKIEEIKEIFNKTKTKTKTESDYLTINENIKNLKDIVEKKMKKSDDKKLLKQLLKKLQLLFILFIILNPFIIRDINNKIYKLKKKNSPIVTNNFKSLFEEIQNLVNKENNKDFIEYINKKTYDSEIEKYITDYSSNITGLIKKIIKILNCRRLLSFGDSTDNNERCDLVTEFEKLKKYI